MRAVIRSFFFRFIGSLFGLALISQSLLASQSPVAKPNEVVASNQSVWTVPDAPIIGVASAGNGNVTINFTPPLNDGGSPILFYKVA